MEADERERQLRDSKLTIHDEALNRYLKDVLCRTVGQDRCKGVRIYIVEVPAFNANMAPNGTMVVWSGMLLRVKNEAELAAVLAHEFAHFELRHSLKGYKQQRRASDFAAWAAVLGGLANTNTSSLQQSLLGSTFQFSREQEEAADRLGFQYLASANYPTAAASELWQHLMAESDASAIGHGQKPKQQYHAGFFDTHPTSLKRAEYLAAESKKIGDTGRDARSENLRFAMASHLPAWLDAQVKLNDFGGTEYLLQQLATNGGWTGELLFMRGELYRLRGNPRDIVTSVQFYREALAAGYAEPSLRRNLGMALLRSGQKTDAQVELKEYLRLSPEANDVKAVQALLAQ
jgi:beta-barrel assembly-enhancing protease